MSEWQPIETAPKDGTRILAIAPPDGHQIVAWGQSKRRANWRINFETGPAWWGAPTHWIPLPAPPEGGQDHG